MSGPILSIGGKNPARRTDLVLYATLGAAAMCALTLFVVSGLLISLAGGFVDEVGAGGHSIRWTGNGLATSGGKVENGGGVWDIGLGLDPAGDQQRQFVRREAW